MHIGSVSENSPGIVKPIQLRNPSTTDKNIAKKKALKYIKEFKDKQFQSLDGKLHFDRMRQSENSPQVEYLSYREQIKLNPKDDYSSPGQTDPKKSRNLANILPFIKQSHENSLSDPRKYKITPQKDKFSSMIEQYKLSQPENDMSEVEFKNSYRKVYQSVNVSASKLNSE